MRLWERSLVSGSPSWMAVDILNPELLHRSSDGTEASFTSPSGSCRLPEKTL